MFTGNRGCLVDDARNLVRHHDGNHWITCLTEFRDHHHELDAPHHWTPVFFLDEAVALAAGHRPCAYCRRGDYNAYRDALAAAGVLPRRASASELNRHLATERLRNHRHRPGDLSRADDRILWPTATAGGLPDGAVVVIDGAARLLVGSTMFRFRFDRWGDPRPRPDGPVVVLTPPTSVAALSHGYRARLHPSTTI